MIAYLVQADNEECPSAIVALSWGWSMLKSGLTSENPRRIMAEDHGLPQITQLIAPMAGVAPELVSLLEQI